MADPRYLRVETGPSSLHKKLGELQASQAKETEDWFSKFILVKSKQGFVKFTDNRQGSWRWRGAEASYAIPGRKRSKKRPHAVDCLSLGRVLEVLQEKTAPNQLDVHIVSSLLQKP